MDERANNSGGGQQRRQAIVFSGALSFRGDRELQRIVDLATSKYQTIYGAISVMTSSREIVLSRVAVPFWETARTQSFCAVAVHGPGEALIVPDASRDARFKNLEVVRSEPRVRFYAGMPMVDRSGYAVGALCVADPKPRQGQMEIEPLVLLAREAERHICW